MSTVASPVSTRDQALAVIAAGIGSAPASKTALAEFGGAVVAQLLIDLEQRFDIGLDPDEAATVGDLLDLVEARAAGKVPGSRVFHWDDERQRRGLPYVSPRYLKLVTREAAGPDIAPAANAHAAPAPPAAPPAHLDPRTPCAVPSVEAWLAAERRDERRITFILAACCAVAGLALAAWAKLNGWFA